MKKYLLLLSIVLAGTAYADKWQGQVDAIRFYIDTDYTREGTHVSIPEMWIDNVPCDTFYTVADTIGLRFSHSAFSMTGVPVASGDSLAARFSVNAQTYKVMMARVDSLQPLFWAQNPCPPYPYTEEDVMLPINDTITLAGTLTLPAGRRRVPAVVLLSGTGKQDRDASFTGHRPFARIADYLSRRGVAVLRLDDRGVGQSTGVYADATTHDFATDALAAVKYLQAHRRIKKSKVGLMGHSEGGAAAMIAAASSSDVAFVVTLAGLSTDGFTSLVLQNNAIIDTYPGFSDEWRRVNKEFLRQLFTWVREIPASDSLAQPLRAKFSAWCAEQPDSILQMTGLKYREEMYIARYLHNADNRWYRELMRYNPGDYVPRVDVPVLALNGDSDIMVPSKENLATADSLLRLGGNKHYRIVELPGLNHMFQHCTTCIQNEIGSLPDVFAEEALIEIYAFLRDEIL
ncbi:MAG: alpha/beta fold hydrolase [Coprobacter sp.]|nr:alpha/beta fold hydrolase [Coprobacter sp.]